MSKRGILIVMFFGTAVLGVSQICPLPQNEEFKPFQNTVQNGPTKFKWYSAAAPNPEKGGGHPSHAFERKVSNLGKGALKYEWEVGRMRNQGLPEGAPPDTYCHEYGWPNQKDGPLNYGRGNDSTDTTVWEGKDEPKKPPSNISARMSFTVSDGQEVRQVALYIQSQVTAVSEGFRYSYLLKNVGKSPTRLNWHMADLAQFRDALKEKHLEFPLDLATGANIENSFFSRSAPTIVLKDIQILSKDGMELAGASVPSLLPQQQVRQ